MAKDTTEPKQDNKEAETPWEVTTERFVAFFDIMGFKDRVANNSHEKIYESLFYIKNTLIDIENSYYEYKEKSIVGSPLKTAIFSDSIVLFTEDNSDASIVAITMASTILILKCLANKIPIKGAISNGLISVDLQNSIYFGKPIIQSYLLHEELAFYGVVVDNEFEKRIKKHIEEHPDTILKNAFITYKTPFKFGYSFHYILNWAYSIDFFLKDNKIQKNPEEIITDLYIDVVGKPRIYLDNTLEYFNNKYVSLESRTNPKGDRL